MAKRLYEIIIALDPAVASAEADGLLSRLTGQITGAGGEIRSVDKHGQRRMAYRVRGKSEANFAQVVCEMEPGQVKELEKLLRLNEGILRFMTTRLEPDQVPPPAAQTGAPGQQT